MPDTPAVTGSGTSMRPSASAKTAPNWALLSNSLGILSQQGSGTAMFNIPGDVPAQSAAGPIGLVAHHAFVVFHVDLDAALSGAVFRRNPAAVQLLPQGVPKPAGQALPSATVSAGRWVVALDALSAAPLDGLVTWTRSWGGTSA